jgi:hypothetical protein
MHGRASRVGVGVGMTAIGMVLDYDAHVYGGAGGQGGYGPYYGANAAIGGPGISLGAGGYVDNHEGVDQGDSHLLQFGLRLPRSADQCDRRRGRYPGRVPANGEGGLLPPNEIHPLEIQKSPKIRVPLTRISEDANISFEGAASQAASDDANYGVEEGRPEWQKGCADMNVQEQIDRYISDQSLSKSEDLRELHRIIIGISPNCKLSFSNGRNSENKIVSNPTIGYGLQTIKYASGDTREYFQVGISGNTTGVSVYMIGVEDKQYLSKAYGAKLGKAKITGYCITFRQISDINVDIFEEMIANHMGSGSARGL